MVWDVFGVMRSAIVGADKGCRMVQNLQNQIWRLSEEPIFDLVALLGSLVDASGVPTVAGLCDGDLAAWAPCRPQGPRHSLST